jgi:tetratricopeptide (TPR) repeat protein
VVQYLPLYQLSHADYLGIMRTFATVFPQATVWFMGVDTVMVGGDTPQRISFPRLAARMTDPKVAVSLREIGLDDPARLLATYCFTLDDVAADLATAPINTDDLPDVEFSAPRSQLINTVRENLPWLLARKRSPLPLLDLPESWPSDDPRRRLVLNRLENAVRVQRLEMQGRLQVLQGDLEGGIATLQQAIATDPADIYARDLTARNLVKLGGRLHAQGREKEAVAAYEESLKWDPRHFLALYNLARLEYDRGHTARARDLTRQALELAPHSPSLNYRMGLLLFQAGELERAELFLKTAADLDPRYPEPLMVLGDIFRGRRQPDRAADLYRRAIEVGKQDAEAHAALAEALIDQGKNDDASAHVALAAREAPTDPEVIFTRARLMLAQGKIDDARHDLQESLRVGGEAYRRRAASDPMLAKLLE